MAPTVETPSTLCLRNRQRTKRVEMELLRRVARHLFTSLLPSQPFELCLHLVDRHEMARLNEKFLGHIGPTDVVTFDHRELEPKDAATGCHGEIFICVDMAVAQAQEFDTTWKEELIRYLVHGALHLHGYNDRTADQRRQMKRREDELIRQLAAVFTFSKL